MHSDLSSQPGWNFNLRHNTTLKIIVILFLTLLMLIPLSMIKNVINERQRLSYDVINDIARSSSYSQQITGPVIIAPYRKTVQRDVTDADTGKRNLVTQEIQDVLYFLPETFKLDGRLSTELRHRSIYETRLYHLDSQISGDFKIPAYFGITDNLEDYTFEQPYLSVGISDIRGIKNALSLQFDRQNIDFQPGPRTPVLGDKGVHAMLPQLYSRSETVFSYGFNLQLLGNERLDFSPIGRDSEVRLAADWLHPGFSGEFLPTSREITDSGFDAHWQTSFFATNMQEILNRCSKGSQCHELIEQSFGVSLVDPVNQYLKSERAIKYALMFILLTFTAFFLFELLKNLRIHPVQYLMVGMAIALFYLLLLSMSEYISFGAAYLISAAACIGLIGIYVSYVLKSAQRSALFSTGLALLYGTLYVLLNAEDYALLAGSVLLFAALGATMILTRKLDWYEAGRVALGQRTHTA